MGEKVTRATSKKVLHYLKTTKGFDRFINKVNIISLENGNGSAEFTIEEEHTNSMGQLNTGCVVHVSDIVSSFALSTHKLANNFFVSINMNFEICNPQAKIGDHVEVHTKTLKLSQTLAFLEILWKNKSTGEILVKGHHNMLPMKF